MSTSEKEIIERKVAICAEELYVKCLSRAEGVGSLDKDDRLELYRRLKNFCFEAAETFFEE
jgi:hypothetical protein